MRMTKRQRNQVIQVLAVCVSNKMLIMDSAYLLGFSAGVDTLAAKAWSEVWDERYTLLKDLSWFECYAEAECRVREGWNPS